MFRIFFWIVNLFKNFVESARYPPKTNIVNCVQKLDTNGLVRNDVTLVLVDASRKSVIVTLPSTENFVGQLSIVCIDPSRGILIVPHCSDVIFDDSNSTFTYSGDALTFITDNNGNWYIISRYCATWYC